MTTPIDLETLTLAKGAHEAPADGLCVMEAVAYVAGEPHSDHPRCVSPVIAEFCRAWNDALPDADRTRLLRPYVRRVAGTATTPEDEATRAWLAADWLVRVQVPAWLRLAGLDAEARALEAVAPLVDTVTCQAASPVLDTARQRTWAAAWAAAGAAAGDAARAAARAAAGDAAGYAARAAARAAAGYAAGAAARAAAGYAAGAAARAAAEQRLAPTVAALQASACDLLDRMIAVGRPEPR